MPNLYCKVIIDNQEEYKQYLQGLVANGESLQYENGDINDRIFDFQFKLKCIERPQGAFISESSEGIYVDNSPRIMNPFD
jgi:hypothetical protein